MMRQAICCALFGVLSAGCASIPLTSIPKLSGLKPETMALERVELAVRVQEDFQLYRNGAKLGMSANSPALEEPRQLALELVPSAQELTPFLQRQEQKGYRIAMFEVNPNDAEEITAFREELLALKAASQGKGKGELSISARANGCLAQGSNPFQKLRMKLYLRADAGEEFFTLFKEQRLSLGATEEGRDELTYCAEEDIPNLLWRGTPY